MTFRVVFRTDASTQIGSGHVMRCLTLATALRERGAECHFVCREHPGNLIDKIHMSGFTVTALAAGDPGPQARARADGSAPAHAAWLGTDWSSDAEATREVLRSRVPAWLVVDHYALDQAWEAALRQDCRHLMVIDDLADRPHDCDLLLDQNLGRHTADYARLVTPTCTILAGPGYALVWPEFVALREYSTRRRKRSGLSTLLISLGGIDTHNVTGRALEVLRRCRLPPDCRIIAVMGLHTSSLEMVQATAAKLPWPCEIRTNVQDMARLMADSDLAIGAAGGTAWERCVLGLPALIVVLADNQITTAAALASAGAGHVIGDMASFPESMPECLSSLDDDALARMSDAAKSICDGRGTSRTVNTMLKTGCSVRPMRENDLEEILRWRNHPDIRRHMLTRHEIDFSEHRAWYLRCVQDRKHHLLIVEDGDTALGFVQFTETGEHGIAEWGFYKSPSAPRGSGARLGVAALDHAFGNLGFNKVIGKVIRSNERSMAFHKKLGFSDEGEFTKTGANDARAETMRQFGLLKDDWL